jgi:addiction module HigA family antidote
MWMTKRKPATTGEILVEEFIKPIGLTQGALADAMGVQRKHVNELCNDRRNLTAATALILARVFGNSPDFWLNVQRRTDLWEAMHSPCERKRARATSDGGGMSSAASCAAGFSDEQREVGREDGCWPRVGRKRRGIEVKKRGY